MLTQEQQAKIKDTRELLQIARYNRIEAVAVEVAQSLIDILDSLPKEQPRQYTERELREKYTEIFGLETGERNTWDGFYECARFIGALKE